MNNQSIIDNDCRDNGSVTLENDGRKLIGRMALKTNFLYNILQAIALDLDLSQLPIEDANLKQFQKQVQYIIYIIVSSCKCIDSPYDDDCTIVYPESGY